MRNVILVLGGARSGKSRFAEVLAESAGPRRTYLATAEPFDTEMRARIEQHRQRRGPGWSTTEAPLDLAAALSTCQDPVVLIDCVTLWLNNLIFRERSIGACTAALCEALETRSGTVILVSNEVGLGLVPDNALSRRFRDEQGTINQALAAVADTVYFVAAGLPLVLKTPASAGQVR